MASLGLSRVQRLCLAAAAISASMGFVAPRTTSAFVEGSAKRFRHEEVLGRSGWWPKDQTFPNSVQVQNACELARKQALRRNERELARCREARRGLPPLNVAWSLGLGASGALLGMGLALSAGEASTRRRVWIGGMLGFCFATGGTLLTQQAARGAFGHAGSSYCEGMADYARTQIPDEYANCLARGLDSIKPARPSR